MIYYKQNIDSFTGIFDSYSVVVLLGNNQNLLSKEAKEIAVAIAGPKAEDEMRITKYHSHEISSKKTEIMSCLKTKSFFPGPSIIMLSEMLEKDFQLIFEIYTAWELNDPTTIITIDKLSKNSELKTLSDSSSRLALIYYPEPKIDKEFLINKLGREGISFANDEVLDAIIEYSKFSPENILEKELEKLKIYKLYDNKPLDMEDFWNLVSIEYETGELKLACELAERNLKEVERNLSLFFSMGKTPIAIMHFVGAYFYKLSLIKIYGASSFEVRREYPFLISGDLDRAQIQSKRWTSQQLREVTNLLTAADIKLREHGSLFQRNILTLCLHQLMEI